MNKITLKSLLFSCLAFFSLVLTAQDAPPSDGVFRLQNVATGEFLTTAGGSTQPLTMSASGEAENTYWSFVESANGSGIYNIDSESTSGGTGILRATGAGFSAGDYAIVSTLKSPPAADTDKVWTIAYNATEDTYRFGSNTTGRYLYQNADGTVTHSQVEATDNRSNWKLIPLLQIPVGTALTFQNVETREFLTTASESNLPVTMSASGEAENTRWSLVESGEYYNIDSESTSGGTGILRAPGAGSSTGAYVILSTLKAPPASDTDKTWSIEYNGYTDTYRFGSRITGRYLYQNTDGTVTHSEAEATDNRSNWRLSPFVETSVGAAPDEDTNLDLSCSGGFDNNNTRNFDIPNPENVGTIDDRTCYSDYSEVSVNGKTWGVYNITDGSNHIDAPNTLQPRMERSLTRSQETGVGSFARFKGIVRILEVGDAGSFNQDGSYLIQAKGKHTGGGGSADPAICLYLAKPVYGTGEDADKQVAFDIYAERILERGGSGSGREVVFLKRVAKNVEIDFELEVGFREDPNDATKKIHYCDAVIGGDAFNFNIPDPERGLESGIRYGAYRVRGGRAQMRWANTTYEKVEIVDNSAPPPTADVVVLKNVETGEFLTAGAGSTQPVSMSVSGGAENTQWTLVQSGAYYNIDSESSSGGNGILRAPGAGGPAGPYVIVSTTKGPPAGDTDKTWTINYNETTDTYRFESRTAGRYLYQNVDGTVTHSAALATDNRSVWKAIPIGEPLELDLVATNVSCAGADDGTANVTVIGGIAPYTFVWNSGEITETLNNVTPGTYSVTVTDALNATISASTEITAPTEIVVTVSANALLYAGYDRAEQCATIGVTAVTGGEGPYDFKWSTGETTEMIAVCPDSTQNYTVTVTDANGCEATAEITVEVIDVSCGTDKNPKVLICHKGKTICVAQAAVKAHLEHGDTIGACIGDSDNAELSIRTYPNPFTTSIKANIETKTNSTVKLLLLDNSGNSIAEKTQRVKKGIETVELSLNTLPIGTYFLRVYIDNELYITEIFIKN
ncbi:T9SS type A sorting domain-containing protein [Cellulophaga tyrosinoxydans]|uniref:Por secretion system C-terminal sorting domain-containing protein n=1 Tax=Cellulophaga tyrosinoxydans TaxID=504486 RepID=A0A1W2C4A2_9FLAO|nr:RICIN domain-containing protein [Cellulophaga tyrosinoxydans]SMC79993.1 Por secretion system C-terminal sorting domain-containing protein [Cellulophaga tyrosinoxydans]